MSREIKFRAWDGKELWQVDRIDFCMTDGMQRSIYSVKRKLEIESYGYLAVHLMQYTGLKDKNRVEIYEGDVVKMWWKEARRGRWSRDVIGFEDGHFCTHYIGQNDLHGYHSGYKKIWDYPSCVTYPIDIEKLDYTEVIGNIYQNPELLER